MVVSFIDVSGRSRYEGHAARGIPRESAPG